MLFRAGRIGNRLSSVPGWHIELAARPAQVMVTRFGNVMKEPTSQQLYAYWNDVRGDRLAPRRFEIEPSRIAAILPDTFILERVDSATFRFRLAGTRICEAFVAEFRGLNILDLLEPIDRATLRHDLATVAGEGGVGLFALEGVSESGKPLMFEMLIVPLIHTNDTVDRLLGSLTPLASPAWLGHEPVTIKRLVSHEIIWPEGRPHAVADAMKRQSPFMPHIRNARIVRVDRRQFRVYEGGLGQGDDERS